MSLAPGAVVPAEHPLLAEIATRRVFAVLRTATPEQAVEVGRACIRGGIRFIEVRLTLRDALSVVRELVREPAAVVGVGMVVQSVEVRDAAGAGARFSVSPHFDPDILAESKSSGLLSLMGGVTATEVMACHRAGVDITKIFPAVTFGPAYLKALRDPLPFLRLMPTGGVDASNLKAWLDAGAVGVALGRSLADPRIVAARDWSIIEGRARRVVEAVALWSSAAPAAGAP